MINKSKEVVIVAAVRTPIGSYKGSLKNIKADQLGSIVINEVLKKSKFNKEEIDEVIMGQVLTTGGGQNPARQAAINAGLPVSKPAHIVNQVCGSGLRAVVSGYQSIKLGEVKNVISGGQENMSIAPHSIFYRDKKEFVKKKTSRYND
jgi:acetyl-CoA C-acetyltransferase